MQTSQSNQTNTTLGQLFAAIQNSFVTAYTLASTYCAAFAEASDTYLLNLSGIDTKELAKRPRDDTRIDFGTIGI